MEPYLLFLPMFVFFAVCGLGHIVIRLLGWNLPLPKSLKESIRHVYWPPEVEGWRVARYRFAQFVVGLVAFAVVMILRARWG
jgi:hypothetical protein